MLTYKIVLRKSNRGKMKKIIIIGAGFAGLSAAKRLSKCSLSLEVTLFDRIEHPCFLPLIPDCIGRGINPELLASDIGRYFRQLKIKFIKEEVKTIYVMAKQVCTATATYLYDFLIVASGSQTNFFSNQDAQRYGFPLNSVTDVEKVIKALSENKFENIIICGGGYTGIETAANFWLYFKKKDLIKKILIVERLPKILGSFQDCLRVYVEENLKKMQIEVLTNTTIENIQENKVTLSSGIVFANPMLIWVAGVRTADYIQKLEVDKNPQGRIVVDGYLRFNQYCFAAGDAAFFAEGNDFLRMAVQFAIKQGQHAAKNIERSIKNIPLERFRPLDLGYIIPMANNKSCGRVFGLHIKGFFPTVLHFVMCVFRLPGFRNKTVIISSLIGNVPNTKKVQGGAQC